MKDRKLNLSELKLQSFVTAVSDKKSETAKGGINTVNCNPIGSLVMCGTAVCTLDAGNPGCFENLNVK